MNIKKIVAAKVTAKQIVKKDKVVYTIPKPEYHEYKNIFFKEGRTQR